MRDTAQALANLTSGSHIDSSLCALTNVTENRELGIVGPPTASPRPGVRSSISIRIGYRIIGVAILNNTCPCSISARQNIKLAGKSLSVQNGSSFGFSRHTHTAKHPNTIAAFDVPRYIEIEWYVTATKPVTAPLRTTVIAIPLYFRHGHVTSGETVED